MLARLGYAYDRNRPEAVTHEYYDERPENAVFGRRPELGSSGQCGEKRTFERGSVFATIRRWEDRAVWVARGPDAANSGHWPL